MVTFPCSLTVQHLFTTTSTCTISMSSITTKLLLCLIVMVTLTMTTMLVTAFSLPCQRHHQRRASTMRQANTDIDALSPEQKDSNIAMEKATKAMTAFTNKYLRNTGTALCADKSVPAVVIRGLAEHKVTLGAPLCPCRFYEDKEAEAKDGYWNCPCVPMRERHECHCMLFLTEDNAFAGTDQVSSCCILHLACCG